MTPLGQALVDAATEAIAGADDAVGTTDAAAKAAVLAVLETLEADLVTHSGLCNAPGCGQCQRATIALSDFRELSAEIRDDNPEGLGFTIGMLVAAYTDWEAWQW